MTRKTLMLSIWRYPYQDFQRGLVFLLASICAVIINRLTHMALLPSIWLTLSAALAGLGLTGNNKWQQTLYYLKFYVASIVAISLALSASIYLSPVSLYLSFTCIALIIFILFSFFTLKEESFISAALVTVFVVIPLNFPMPKQFHWTHTAAEVWLPFLVGCVFSLLFTLLLPKISVNPIKIHDHRYFLIRSFRISLAVFILLIVCSFLKLTHSSWAVISAIFVSQHTLGATIKRGWYRLFGTALGIVIASLFAFYLFSPFPLTRYLALPFIFISFIISSRSYPISIFLVTISLGALFYILSPANQTVGQFIFERLIETLLGISVIVILEMLIYPKSVINIIRQHAGFFWKNLALAIMTEEKEAFSTHCQQAKKELDFLQTNLAELRYEAIIFISKRYHYSKKIINSLFHYQALFIKTNQEEEISEEVKFYLKLLYEALANQYNLDLNNRRIYLSKLGKKIKSDMLENQSIAHSLLVQKLYHIIRLSKRFITLRRFSPQK